MAATKTINFLPEIFRSDANKKFLNATMDQLVQEPNFKRISGYIGRKFAPTFKSTDSYIIEDETSRQHYQLEPSAVIIDPTTNEIASYSNYPDFINKLKFYGGNVDNHSRLFENEMYSYDGKFDFDKFVNFSQYYWLPNGPDAVLVTASGVPMEQTFVVNLNSETGTYYFTDANRNTGNENIVFARGGIYTFDLTNTTDPFWIQSKVSADGKDPSRPNVTVRDVYGVVNNGAKSGVVTFTVPPVNGQARFTNMQFASTSTNGSIDYATALTYRELQGSTLAAINALGGLDGQTGDIAGKKIIFTNPSDKIDDYYWTAALTDNVVVPLADRTKTWTITLDGDTVVLTATDTVNVNEKVYIRSGDVNATRTFYIDYHNRYVEYPTITATLGTLYFQNGNLPSANGLIKIIDPAATVIDPSTDIIGKATYTSPTGVVFTNGLKVKFDSSAIGGYASNEYYVEGVGKSISLVPVSNMVAAEVWDNSYVVFSGTGYNAGDVLTVVGGTAAASAELYVNSVTMDGGISSFSIIYGGDYSVLPTNPVAVTGGNGTGATFNVELQPATKDYMTINRSGIDINAWSRSNRWFHLEVVKATASYNGTDFILDQNEIAKRPIIEFEPNIKLFNYGSVAKAPIDVLDTKVTRAYQQVENISTQSPDIFTVYDSNNNAISTLRNGDRVIFSNDEDINVRDKIYKFNIVDVSETTTPSYIGIITETGETIVVGNNILVLSGEFAGQEFFYDGAKWVVGQQKLGVNQAPRFDMFDSNDISFGDVSTYVNSTFTGTTILEYAVGIGANDPELGFPLSYRTFNNVGDIQFNNSYDTGTFTFLMSPQTVSVPVNTGLLHITAADGTFGYSNIWTVVDENSKQYQLISHTADGVNNLFEIDILPNPTKTIPNIKVFLNNTFLTVADFGLSQIGARYAVLINPTLLTSGDSITILIYSDSVSEMGFYEIPPSLDNNAENLPFDSLTLGQMRNHLIALTRNSVNISGNTPGNSNARDVSFKSQGGSIINHSASMVYSQINLMDDTLNVIDSTKYAQREYARFKNKFLELASQTHLDIGFDVAEVTDTILKTINGIKNINFPWYYSDMVPYGENKKTLPPYTVLDPRIRSYELTTIFDDTVLSNKAVLVYLTRTANNATTKVLLAKGIDYTFSKTSPSFTITDTFNLNYGDILTVVEYSNTDGNYIPETPTKLGLYPKFTPSKFLDNTFVTPTNVIQGHDGSITIAFNDFRDDLLLELEMRIYDNIKIDSQFDAIAKHLPGKFRITDYSLTEFNQVLTNNFLTWVGNNRIDYTSNHYFDETNPWTYNYKNFKDSLNAEYLPGTWRAVFKWFYDTDRPHTHPWEMLGFSEKPTWWEDRYGPAPYTGGNLNLWSDLSIGYIHAGDRAGLDSRYARPNLLQIIPVDDSGNLRSPNEFATINFNLAKANASFAIGDQGPVEAAWRRSSDYPYALQMALALTKPGVYFGLFPSVSTYRRNSKVNQYLNVLSNQHLTLSQIGLNGFNDGTTIYREAGYVNWLVDFLTGTGVVKSREYVYGLLNSLGIKLSYKAAGFTDKNYLKVVAEQGSSSTNESIVIPDENYHIYLNKSAPVDRIVYSAVIVEKTAGGYTVSGYALDNPYFTIIPSLANNNAYTITTGKATGTIYKDYQKSLVKIPYGYEFTSTQQVVDFLVSYQRFLQSKGFVFIDTDPTLNTKRDWILSATEFLTWAQQGWDNGNILVLSPVNDRLNVSKADSVVDVISGSFNSSKLLDPNFAIIKPSAYTIIREDNGFTVSSIKNQTICLAELNMVQYEHVLVFDNKTVFNDVVYSPSTGNRRYRLKLVGFKTGAWTGELNPAGFVYNSKLVDKWQSGVDYRKGQLIQYKNLYYTALDNIPAAETFSQTAWKQINQAQIKTGLLPNFALNAQFFENIYDIDNPVANEKLNFYSAGITGFRERSYLTDLGIDMDTQTKFYQGYIKQKGTKESINALAKAQIGNINSEVSVFEEWAVRVGEYGATDINKFVEVVLDESAVTANPVALQFVPTTTTAEAGALVYMPSDYYKSNIDSETQLFGQYDATADKPSLPAAGFVNVDDINATIYDLANYRNLDGILNKIGTGYTIWTAKDFSGQWNVFRVCETEVGISSLSYNIDNVATFTTSTPHDFSIGDVLAVKNFDNTYDGFYQIHDITSIYSFNVVLTTNFTTLRDAGTIYGSGLVFKLTSSRVAYPHLIDTIMPKFGWNDGDKVWVDTIDTNGNWGVYDKQSPWVFTKTINLNSSEYQTNSHFGNSVRVSADGKFMYVGAEGAGRAAVFVKVNKTFLETSSFVDTEWIQNGSFTVGDTDADRFGHMVEFNEHTLVVSAPGSNSNKGYVFVYTVDPVNGISIGQLLTAPTMNINGNFGDAISSSEDGDWLYVGEPGVDKVHVYTWIPMNTSTQQVISGTTTTALIQSVDSAMSILVNGSRPYVAGVDYTISGGNITFTPTLTESVVITYHSYYKYVTSISGQTGSNFGYSLKANPSGTQIVIGANLDGSEAGSISVYDRSVETFIADGTNNTYIPTNTLGTVHKVTIDGLATTDYTVYGNSISLTAVPQSGSIIGIETNAFNFVQKMVGTPLYGKQQMGYSVDICSNTCSVYAGAPKFVDVNYGSGAVYRFINQGKLFGSMVGNVKNPTVTIGHSIRINGKPIVFSSGNTINDIIIAINSANIAGITASNSNGFLQLTSTRIDALNKLEVLPNTGTAYTDIGFTPFTQAQIIKHAPYIGTERFGETIKISDDALTLVVGSLGSSTHVDTVFDSATTLFDVDSTKFKDSVSNSGAAYVYSLMSNPNQSALDPSQMVFIQELTSSILGADFNFGASIDFKNNTIYVGVPNDNSLIDGGGSVYEFENKSLVNWNLIRQNAPRTDVASVTRAFLYNKQTQMIVANLEVFDPLKGKILGVAEQDLDFKTEQDPAIYNNGFLNYHPTYHWTGQQVGKLWWDLGQTRFIDYEQGSLIYKNKHWGEMFSGSNVVIYEWVESPVLPSQYVASGRNGVPKYVNDTNYVSYTHVDSATGVVMNSYYFWVSGKTTVDVLKTHRTNSPYVIQQIIKNPKDQGIPYVSLLGQNAVGLYNVSQYLTDSNVVLHLDFSKQTNSNIIHAEYELIKQGANGDTIPTRLVNKLQDSLAGVDATGLLVPSPNLSVSERYGIDIRPHQTMFVNRLSALANFVKYVNGVFILHPMADQFTISNLNLGEPKPAAGIGEWDISVATEAEVNYIDTNAIADGYLVLVEQDTSQDNLWVIYKWVAHSNEWMIERVQSYLTSLYYDLVDWYSSDYDNTIAPTYTVDTYNGIQKLTLVSGDTIKVNNDGDSRFAFYRVNDSLALDRVGSERGTIQLKSSLYDLAAGNMGFDNDSFDTIRFDQTPSIETRYVFAAVVEDLLIKDLKGEFNNVFFNLVNYIFSEQKAPDWIFKSSFISVLHKVRELAQYPSYIKDNQTFYEDYINEVKPYRTTIREYVPSQYGTDYLHTGATDFDLPAYYDSSTNTYRQPSGEMPTDANLLLTTDYIDWTNNYKYKVTAITVVNGGTGFISAPELIIQGGGGTGATAIANISNGAISHVFITNPGSGYTSTPQILVKDIDRGVILVPVLHNEYYSSNVDLSYNTTRNISTTIKFDRVDYTTSVTQWTPHTAYVATLGSGIGDGNVWLASGQLVQYNNEVYLPKTANITSEATFDGDLYEKLNAGNVLLTTNNRIMGYYQPTVGMPSKDLTSLVDGIEYGGVFVQGVNYPTGGVDFPTANPTFANANVSFIDSTITSSYIDSDLGTRPEDINVDGGAYVDEYSSHAPQELLPGRVYDTLDMKVFTANTASISNSDFYLGRIVMNSLGSGYSAGTCQVTVNGMPGAVLTPVVAANGAITSITITAAGNAVITSNPTVTITGANTTPASATAFLTQATYGLIGYRVFQNMNEVVTYARLSAANTVTLTADLNLTDSVIHVSDASALPLPSIELANPGVVFINGEQITYYTIDTVANTLGQLRRAVDGTGAPAVHSSGSLVVDSSSQQLMGGNVNIETWLNMTANIADGTGLVGSTSTEAQFLKSSMSYIP